MISSVPPAFDAPSRIGPYQLLLPIGTGGMATVYLARREIVAGAWREFALKLLHPQLRAEPSLADQLLAEARLVAAIRHPNVVQVIEAGERPEAVYLVMEYVEGDTLAGLIRHAIATEQHIPIPIVGRILLDGLLGLHAAHEASGPDGHPLGLVHRDFSPQNLLVGRDGLSRLTDFGIAKVMHRMGATATGIVKGKVSYMAPEQARGERLDRRCDVWAAGVVLWEALAARRLFSGSNDAALVLEIVAGGTPRRVSSARREVSSALDEVVSAALARDRRARIGDAEELRRRFEAALAEHGIADASDVARYVDEATGDKLVRRREAVNRVTGLRRQLATLSEAATRESLAASGMTPPPGEPEIIVDVGGLTGETAVSSDLAIAPRRRGRGRWIAAAALAALTVAGAVVVVQARRATPSLAASRLAERFVAAERTAAPPPAEPAGPLRVQADAPVAQLHVGKRSVALPDPRAEFEVPLTDEERAASIAITFVAADRRRTTVQVGPRDAAVSVQFPAPAIRRPLRKKEPAGPDIVDNPYGGP